MKSWLLVLGETMINIMTSATIRPRPALICSKAEQMLKNILRHKVNFRVEQNDSLNLLFFQVSNIKSVSSCIFIFILEEYTKLLHCLSPDSIKHFPLRQKQSDFTHLHRSSQFFKIHQ